MRKVLLWTVVLLLAPVGARAAPLDAAAVLQGVQDWLDGTEDLQGRFEQTLVSGAMGTGLTESGRLFIQRPGRMRWEYREPERKLALVDGSATQLYLEEDAELIRGRLDAESDLMTTLLAGTIRLAERFRPTLVPADGARLYLLELEPLAAEQSFQQVLLTVRAPRFAIEAAEVLDSAGNRMRYEFPDLRRNRGLPAGLFHFEPPPGTVISGGL